jgi:hypothetical protein
VLVLDDDDNGYYVSALFDGGRSRAWRTISWTAGAPSFKPLPGDGEDETGYLDGNADMSDNLLLLHLDRADSGAVLADDSPQDLTATCDGTGCPTVESGLMRGGRLFDGVDDIIRIPAGVEIEPPNFTIETWGRVDPDPDPPVCEQCFTRMFVGKGRSEGAPFTSYSIEYLLETEHLKCYADIGGVGIEVESTATYSANVLLHVACSYDGAQVRLFVDGVPAGSQPATGAVGYDRTTTDDLVIGGYGISEVPVDQRFYGMLDEIALWGRALEPAEIADHADRGYQRVTFQVRTCETAPCDGPWLGPDGTSGTRYSEACVAAVAGPPVLTLDGLDCDGDGAADGAAIPTGRYVQYQVWLDSLRMPRSAALHGVTICD